MSFWNDLKKAEEQVQQKAKDVFCNDVYPNPKLVGEVGVNSLWQQDNLIPLSVK